YDDGRKFASFPEGIAPGFSGALSPTRQDQQAGRGSTVKTKLIWMAALCAASLGTAFVIPGCSKEASSGAEVSAAEKAASQKAASQKTAADKAAADKDAAANAAAAKAKADRLAADKASSDKAAADKAAAAMAATQAKAEAA